MIRRLCIIGVGLIGGSLARALRKAGYAEEIVGTSRRAEHLQEAVDLGVIDRFDTDAARAVEGADMIVLGLLWYAVDAWVLAPIERATGQRWGMVQRQ